MSIDPRHPEVEGLWRAVAAAAARSIAVVAANPGEGCTTIAEALWRRAALAGHSALLVELNRDRPALASRLGNAGPGQILSFGNDGLGLMAEPSDAMLDTWRDPARLAEAIAGWHQTYDTVVLDGAPLVARGAQGLPGLACATAAEATMLVVLAGRTPASAVREARQALTRAGARLLGTVLNDRDNPSLLAELEREAARLGRLVPALAARIVAALRRSSLLGIRV
jgi:Mrp family chromosome partitioning ATPase